MFVLKELHSREIISSRIALGLIVGVGVVFFAVKRIISKKYPSLAPPKDEMEDIDLSNTDDMVEVPRTVGSTILELVLAALFAVACYKAWVTDKTLLIFVGLLAIATGIMLLLAYYPTSKEGEVNPKATAADIVISRRMRVRSVAMALLALGVVFLPMRYSFIIICTLYVALRLIFSLIIKGASDQPDGASKFNINEVKVHHTPAAIAYEAVTILLLIGAWVAAYYTHLFEGKGILNLSGVEMICCSALTVIALIITYCPRWMNRSESFVNSQQLTKCIELYRFLAIGFAVATLTVVYLPYKGTNGLMDTIAQDIFIIIIAIDIIYRQKIRRELVKSTSSKNQKL